MLLRPNNHASRAWNSESHPAGKGSLEIFVYGEKAD